MKRRFVLITLALLLAASGCDYIDDPIEGDDPVPVDPNPVDVVNKVVLIKDFTGAQCVQCPAAAETAHELQHQLGEDRIFVMGVHAGPLAQPAGQFPNFTTEEGTQWYGNNDSNPLFSVDYVGLEPGHVLYVEQLDTPVVDALQADPVFGVEISCTFDTLSRQLEATVSMTALAESTGDFWMTLCLVEDSLVGWQKIPGGLDREYVFRNVFRGTLNGADGEAVHNGPCQIHDRFEAQRSMTLDAAFNADHCCLVAYLYDLNQEKRILQTAVKKIK